MIWFLICNVYIAVCTTSVEMYRCQQQSVISHFNNEDRESSTSDEDYDTPTDVDTSEKETVRL